MRGPWIVVTVGTLLMVAGAGDSVPLWAAGVFVVGGGLAWGMVRNRREG